MHEPLQIRKQAEPSTADSVRRAKPKPPIAQAKSDEIGEVQPTKRMQFNLLAGVQAKLTIGQPNDQYEQEADRVAAQVVNQIHAPTAQSQPVQREELPEDEELQMKPEIGSIQREKLLGKDEELQMKPMVQLKAGGDTIAALPYLEASINQARGGGRPLDQTIREPIEQAMGADFSGVKVHTNAQADQLSRSIQARAFTTGQDVFFRQGEYHPASGSGQELIAHELTHVVQQNGGAVQQSKINFAHQSLAQSIQRQIVGVTELWIMSDENLIKALKDENVIGNLSINIQDVPRFSNRLNELEKTAENDDQLRRNIEQMKLEMKDLQKGENMAENEQVRDEWKDKAAVVAVSQKRTTTKPRNIYLGAGETINAQINNSADQEKKERREDKTLMVPDQEWTWGINRAWLESAAGKRAQFKLLADVPSDVQSMIDANKGNGEAFLKDIYRRYSTTDDKNDFWHTKEKRFTYFSEELAILLDNNYILLSDKKIIMKPPSLSEVALP